MRDVTLVLPIRDGRILLGMKKRGFGEGKVNGFGGKLNEGESIVEAAVRELAEEVGIATGVDDLNKMAELTFNFPHAEDDWDQVVHVFLINDWEGEPEETEEMAFEWHDLDKIPFERMWDDDKHWLPEVLKGRKVKGEFSFGEDNSSITAKEIVDLA
jgi:8-oxo-dGTP diphosphatase